MRLNRRSLLALFAAAPATAIAKERPAATLPVVHDLSHVIMYGDRLLNVPMKEYWLEAGDRFKVSSGETWFVSAKTLFVAEARACFDVVNESVTPFPSNFFKI